LEVFQNPFNVLGRALRHTSLGVLCWLEVIDLDPFLGFLFLAPHVWSLLPSLGCLLAVFLFVVQELTMFGGQEAAHRLANAAHFLLHHAFLPGFWSRRPWL